LGIDSVVSFTCNMKSPTSKVGPGGSWLKLFLFALSIASPSEILSIRSKPGMCPCNTSIPNRSALPSLTTSSSNSKYLKYPGTRSELSSSQSELCAPEKSKPESSWALMFVCDPDNSCGVSCAVEGCCVVLGLKGCCVWLLFLKETDSIEDSEGESSV